jgi:4-nitrophenyl phosphatase
MQSFVDVRALIIDMDGVLWHGDRPQAGLQDFFQTLRDLQLPFVLATNNASLTADQYIDKLAGMGVEIVLTEILTSGMATAFHLAQNYDSASTRIFVIGGVGARQPLIDHGFELIDLYQQQADLVVCGLDKQLSWDKLATASFNIQAGAEFIATNGDTSLPTEQGLVPGNGATLAALQAVTGVAPKVIGKPEPIIYQQALAVLGVDPAHTIAIGDRLDTDILGAVRTGIRSALVLTGVSSQQEVEVSDYQPTWIFADIIAVADALRNQSLA